MDVEGMDEDMVTWVRAIEVLQTLRSVFIIIAHIEGRVSCYSQVLLELWT